MASTSHDDFVPSLSGQGSNAQPTVTIHATNAKVNEQGVTYNQAGYTYNQAGWAYGGAYNLSYDDFTPSITGFEDAYTNSAPQPPNNQRPVGVGWFMYVSQ